MSTAPPAVKQKGAKKKASSAPVSDLVNGNADISATLESLQTQTKQALKSEWDYKLALGVITIVALITRFWHITYPDEVVFDEVHFGKVVLHDRHTRDEANAAHSLRHTTFRAPTSSTFTLPLASSCLPLLVGS